MTKTASAQILYMEDDPGCAWLLQRKLNTVGYLTDIARDGLEGLAMYEAKAYDVVVVDQVMPGCQGLEVINRLSLRGPLPPIIMITGGGDERIAVQALKLGACDYLVKDISGGYLELLPSVIEQVLYQQRLIREKQQAEDALRQQTIELQARNEELNAFAHTVAHDLKDPLLYVVGLAEILKETHNTIPTEKRQELLDTIAEHGFRMSNIIDELLLLASIRKQNIELNPIDMGRVIAEVQQRLIYLTDHAKTELILPSAWPEALGYGPWIEEVWANYISNAVKYSGKPPRIELGSNMRPNNTIRFWVHDNGQGLEPQEQARLFTQFTQLERIRATGHGLGLSIVRRIMERLGGEVGVESEIGGGSTFWFVLPCAKATLPSESSIAAEAVSQ